jgi:hypothetical protein
MKSFPNDKQPPNSETCGPQSLANIYQALNIKASVDEIAHATLRDTHKGSMLGHLALHALQQGLDVQYYSANPFHVALEWQSLHSEQIALNIEMWMKNYPDDRAIKKLKPLCEFLHEGGQLHIQKSITSKLLDELIDRDFVLLGAVASSWLWGKRRIPDTDEFDGVKGRAEGHFVVVYGFDDNNYFVSDPYPTGLPTRNGTYVLEKEVYLTTLINYDAEFIAVKQ